MGNRLIGIWLISIGIFIIIWYICLLISCILISGLISVRLFHLTGLYWWCSSIIIFALLCKLVYTKNIKEDYDKLVSEYTEGEN